MKSRIIKPRLKGERSNSSYIMLNLVKNDAGSMDVRAVVRSIGYKPLNMQEKLCSLLDLKKMYIYIQDCM